MNIVIQSKGFSFVEQETPSFVIPEEIHYKFDFNQHREEKIKKFYDKHTALFHRINNQVADWQERDDLFYRWGLGESGFYQEVSREAKTTIIKDEVFRYFKRQTREPLKDQLKTWQRGLERNYEIDERNVLLNEGNVFVYSQESYDALEKRKEAKKSSPIDKKVKLSKNYRLRFKPRLFKGVLVVDLNHPWVNINSTLGVSGYFDINLSRNFSSIKLYTALNFNLDEGRILFNADKALTDNLRLRLSSEKNSSQGVNFEDRTLISFNYFLRF